MMKNQDNYVTKRLTFEELKEIVWKFFPKIKALTLILFGFFI